MVDDIIDTAGTIAAGAKAIIDSGANRSMPYEYGFSRGCHERYGKTHSLWNLPQYHSFTRTCVM